MADDAVRLAFAFGGCNAAPGALAALPAHKLAFYASGPNIVVVDLGGGGDSSQDDQDDLDDEEKHDRGRGGGGGDTPQPPAWRVDAVLPTRRRAPIGAIAAVSLRRRNDDDDDDDDDDPNGDDGDNNDGNNNGNKDNKDNNAAAVVAVVAASADGSLAIAVAAPRQSAREHGRRKMHKRRRGLAWVGPGGSTPSAPAPALAAAPALDAVYVPQMHAVVAVSAGLDAKLRLWRSPVPAAFLKTTKNIPQHCPRDNDAPPQVPRTTTTKTGTPPTEQKPLLLPTALELLASPVDIGPPHLLPECLAITMAHGGAHPLIALGGTDRLIRLFHTVGGALQPLGAPIAGHRDWIRSLRFSLPDPAQGGAFFLASGSTDATACVWKFRPSADPPQHHMQDIAPAAASSGGDCDAHALLSPDRDGENAAALLRGIVRLSVTEDGCIPLDCTLVARLTEHTAAVLSVVFSDDIACPVLLTAAMDGSVALWRVDPQSGRWDSLARFGLLGGAGTHTVGFCGAVFASRGSNHVLAHTLGGAMHAWRSESSPSARSSNHEETKSTITFAQYMAESAPGGHISTVNSLAWAPNGQFLMSCGEDKTTRIFLQPAERAGFVECSRPQVHGHPIRDIAFINCSGNAFVSASEEKVLRIFDAPSQCVLPSINSELSSKDSMVAHSAPLSSHFAALSASVPELGLSNKPVYAEGKHLDKPTAHTPGNLDPQASTETSQLERRPWKSSTVNEISSVRSFGSKRSVGSMPLEGELRQNCLWPERAKLYGHGNELSCVTTETSAGIIASASRAQTARDAVIILWDAITGVEMTRLAAHDLTVNQLRFSPDGRALLSVSRDRSFSVFHRKTSSENRASLFKFELKTRRLEAHARLINAGCWLLGSNVVATGSRDKFVKLFDLDEASADGHSLLESSATTKVRSQKFPSGVSALDSRDLPGRVSQVLAIGLDNGSVVIASVYRLTNLESADVLLTQLLHIPSVLQCSDRVAAIAWRPEIYSDGMSEELQLAVGSDDHVVRIYGVPKVLLSCKSPQQSTEFRF